MQFFTCELHAATMSLNRAAAAADRRILHAQIPGLASSLLLRQAAADPRRRGRVVGGRA